MHIKTPLTKEMIRKLRCGDEVFLSGAIYTARDQAHQRIAQAHRQGKKLPFNLEGQVIYYCGPTRTPKGKPIGSCGPTTSRRMDGYTPLVLNLGLAGSIGKGARSESVRRSIKKHGALYFLAPAGCGALLAQYVKRCRIIGYRGLGPEAIRRLEVEDFPLIVAIDSKGNSMYKGRL